MFLSQHPVPWKFSWFANYKEFLLCSPRDTNCTKLHQKIKKEKTRPEERYSAPINGQPTVARLPPSPGFRRRQALADKSADKSVGQVGVRRRRGGWKMVNHPLNLRPAKNRHAPSGVY
jgi:hypothetical protein